MLGRMGFEVQLVLGLTDLFSLGRKRAGFETKGWPGFFGRNPDEGVILKSVDPPGRKRGGCN